MLKVSIVTVAFNSARTIRDTIESVLSQDYPNLEYVIIDGGSSDGTIDIIEEYRARISVIVSEPDEGIYDAMNKGVQRATGDLIGILNSDDIYDDAHVISSVVSTAHRTDADLVFGDLVYVQQNDTSQVVRRWKSRLYYRHFFEHGHVPPHPALFVRSYVYRVDGAYRLRYKLAADYEFMLRAFKGRAYSSEYIPRVLVRMRLGGATNSSIRNIVRQNGEILQAWRENALSVPLMLIPRRIVRRLFQFL